MHVNRTYKFKLEPNKLQGKELNKIIGSCRYIYNLLLHFNIEQYKKYKKTILVPDMHKMVALLLTKKVFLNEVPKQILESIVITLKSNINNSLKRNGTFPPFRKKGFNDYFSLINELKINDGKITIPSVGHIRFKQTRSLENVSVKTVEITKKNNQWFLSLLVLRNIKTERPLTQKAVGVDVGIKEFAILSSGETVSNPQFYRKLESKLKWEQQKLSRKIYKSSGWHKQKTKVQKIHDKIYNCRMNFLHTITSELIKNYDVIGIEKLSIRTMAENRRLSKSILDASWGTFIELLKYKAKEHSKSVVEVGRFFPSSQLCSNCGGKQIMPLHLRTYACKNCHHEIDRDYNAAKNIENKALEIYLNQK